MGMQDASWGKRPVLSAMVVACLLGSAACLSTYQLSAGSERPAYLWKSFNKQTMVEFVCKDGGRGIEIHVRDPQRAAVGKTYPVDVRTAVSYSPALGAERDRRVRYHERFVRDRVTIGDSRQFLRDLRALHAQELDYRAMLRAEYNAAVNRCHDVESEAGRNRCFEATTPAPYFSAFDPHPSLTVDLTHHTDLGLEEDFHAARTVSAFNSEELFRGLAGLPCYAAAP